MVQRLRALVDAVHLLWILYRICRLIKIKHAIAQVTRPHVVIHLFLVLIQLPLGVHSAPEADHGDQDHEQEHHH